MLNFIKQLFCRHNWINTKGIGVYQKGEREIISIPTTRYKCSKCKKVRYIFDSLNRG